MMLRNTVGYDGHGSQGLVGLASRIRKEINAMEMHCKHYAENVREYYNEYYIADNATLNSLIGIQNELIKIIEKES